MALVCGRLLGLTITDGVCCADYLRRVVIEGMDGNSASKLRGNSHGRSFRSLNIHVKAEGSCRTSPPKQPLQFAASISGLASDPGIGPPEINLQVRKYPGPPVFATFRRSLNLRPLRADTKPCLFSEAGLVDIAADLAIQAHPPGHSRRPIFRDFVMNVREQLVAGGFTISSLRISNVTSALTSATLPILASWRPPATYFRLHGRVPA